MKPDGRSLACHAWAAASGADGGFPGPVHLNLPLRDPLVPGLPDAGAPAGAAVAAGGDGWPEPLAGRDGGAPWIRWAGTGQAEWLPQPGTAGTSTTSRAPPTTRPPGTISHFGTVSPSGTATPAGWR